MVAFPVEAKLEEKLTSTGVVKGFPKASVRLTVTLVEPPGARSVARPSTGVEMVTCGKTTEKVDALLILTPPTVAEVLTVPLPVLPGAVI